MFASQPQAIVRPLPRYIHTDDDTVADELNDLSQMIGELRNFAAAQVATNEHIVRELKTINDKMGSMGELSATFTTYRGTLHERFNKIHEQFGEVDETVERHETRLRAVEDFVTTSKQNIKMIIAITWISSTLISSLLSQFGGNLLKALVHF